MSTNEAHDRVEGYEKRADLIDERLNIHSSRLERIDLVLQGDSRLKIPGLIQNMDDLHRTLEDFVEWRKELMIYARMANLGGRIILILLGLIVGGVWWPSVWPQMQVLIKLLGG